MVTFVLIAGYFFVFATFRINTHLVFFFGAMSFVPLMLQGPDSDHCFFPVEMEVRCDESREVLPFFTMVFFTVKPGRTAVVIAAAVT